MSIGTGATTLPLSGVTVADFSWVLAGPRCTEWLGAMGARVIKIEGPRRPDQYRANGIHEPGHTDLESSGAFHTLNYSKLGCTIDFTTPQGLALAKRVIEKSDVVVENFAYGVLQRVGLDYDVIREIRPDIIMVSSSAMGKTGPDRHHVAYGALIHSFAGISSVTGYPGDDFGELGGTFTDPLTGSMMAYVTLAALWHRRRTGEGQLIDVSMVEASLMQLAPFVMDYTANGRVAQPDGNSYGVAAPHNCYPCLGDDRWVAISVLNQDEWSRFREALNDPEWTRDPRFADQLARFRHRDALDAMVGEWTSTRTAEEVMICLQAAGVAAGPAHDAAGMYQDPQLNARDFFVEVDHPVVGRKPVMRMPWLTESTSSQYWAAPLLGQDNDMVFREILGLSEAEVAALRSEGVIT